MIKEIIVVEGRDDVTAVKRALDAELITTGGFGFPKGVMERIKAAQKRRGVIIFTDPDFAGEKIRKKIAQEVPGCKHAFLPREEAKKDGDIGIENASPESILKALNKVRTESSEKRNEFGQDAIDIAKTGKKVAVISSGDAGIYGMAGLILELITKQELDIPVKVVPGVTASIGAAAVLGAPIMHDFCHISLSDLMTPWEVIEKRLRLAAEADFVICLYNPRSKGRSEHLANAFKIMGEFKDGSTPVGIVKDVGREDQEKFICTFDTMDFERVDMTTMVIIGNKSTYIHDDLMITPRGYTV